MIVFLINSRIMQVLLDKYSIMFKADMGLILIGIPLLVWKKIELELKFFELELEIGIENLGIGIGIEICYKTFKSTK